MSIPYEWIPLCESVPVGGPDWAPSGPWDNRGGKNKESNSIPLLPLRYLNWYRPAGKRLPRVRFFLAGASWWSVLLLVHPRPAHSKRAPKSVDRSGWQNNCCSSRLAVEATKNSWHQRNQLRLFDSSTPGRAFELKGTLCCLAVQYGGGPTAVGLISLPLPVKADTVSMMRTGKIDTVAELEEKYHELRRTFARIKE